MVGQILIVFAFVFAMIAALFTVDFSRPPISVHFGWLAVAFWILAHVLGGFGYK